MSPICGCTGSGSARAALAMAARLPGQAMEPLLLAGSQAALAGRSPAGTLSAARHDGYLAVIAGEARWHGAAEDAAENLAARLLATYRRLGPDALVALVGPFSAAILREDGTEALLAVDRLGIHNLLYTDTPGRFAFSSRSASLLAHPRLHPELDPQSMLDYVHFHMVPAPATPWRGVRRLLPGEYVHLAGGEIRTGRYWRMRFVEDEERPLPKLKREFVALVAGAVRQAAGDDPVGTFLSGGTDSSTLAGMLGKVRGEPARTYSIGFDAAGFDEMEYARIAARHFGTDHHEYYVTPRDVVDAVPRIAAAHDAPFGNASAVPTYYCARMARADGVERLLGGDGGDELFGGNERYATQRLYALYGDLPLGLRRGVVEPALAILPSALPGLRKLGNYVRHASLPMPARYDHYNLLTRLGCEHVFTPEFLQGADPGAPLELLGQVYGEAQAASALNRMLALDLKFTLADSDLPKVVRACELAGVEVAFPLLDPAVVEFSARLAPWLKLKGTRLRWFFKEALRDFLPQEIIRKPKHGFGLPFGVWLCTDPGLRALAGDTLGTLKGRGLVRPEFIDELLGERVAEHANYYGTMVWVLMMLELWLEQQQNAAAAPRPESGESLADMPWTAVAGSVAQDSADVGAAWAGGQGTAVPDSFRPAADGRPARPSP